MKEPSSKKPMSVDEKIIGILREADRPMGPKEITDSRELSYGYVRKRVRVLDKEGKIRQVGPGQYVLSMDAKQSLAVEMLEGGPKDLGGKDLGRPEEERIREPATGSSDPSETDSSEAGLSETNLSEAEKKRSPFFGEVTEVSAEVGKRAERGREENGSALQAPLYGAALYELRKRKAKPRREGNGSAEPLGQRAAWVGFRPGRRKQRPAWHPPGHVDDCL